MYALEFKQKLIEKENFAITDIREIMSIAAPHWEKLSQDEKQVYKNEAATSSIMMDLNPSKKRKRLDFLGVDIDQFQRTLNAEKKAYEKMADEINLTVTQASDVDGTKVNCDL